MLLSAAVKRVGVFGMQDFFRPSKKKHQKIQTKNVNGTGAIIRIGQGIHCILYAGFFPLENTFDLITRLLKDLKHKQNK